MNVLIDHNHEKIREQKLCWLLQNETIKVSSDITRRYIPNPSVALKELQNDALIEIWQSDVITRGDTVILFSGVHMMGVVTGFQKSKEKNKKARTF